MKRLARWIAVGAALGVVSFAVGYAFSSSWGLDLLRREVETLLSDVMEGAVEIDEVRVVLSGGIGLHGVGVRVYPSATESGASHALRAETVYVELNEPALLLGDFELALLVVDDAVLEVTRDEDDRWSLPPLQSALDERPPVPSDGSQPTPLLDVLADTEDVARTLLEEVRVADRVVVRRGTVVLVDRVARQGAREGTPVQRFQLHQIEGTMVRPWLSDDGQLALTAVFIDPNGNEAPVRCTSFTTGGDLEVALTAMDFELNAVSSYVQRLDQHADLEGRISGEVRLTAEKEQPGTQAVVASLALQKLAPTVAFGDGAARLEIPMEVVDVSLEVEPEVARLVGTRFRGSGTFLDFEASVERPINSGAVARIRTELGGLSTRDVRPLVDELPPADSEALLDWFSRLESGTVDRLSLSGATSLETWRGLLDGELAQLPDGFLLGFEVSDVSVRLDEDDHVEDGSFAADFAADRLEIRRARGLWRGEPLPELNVTIDGLSDFAGAEPSAIQTNARPLPGITLVRDLFVSDDDEAPEPYRFHVDFDYLDHPIIGWPIEKGHVTVQPIPHGTESVVSHALWGGVPVTAEVVYLLEPETVITIGVQAHRGGVAPEHPVEIEAREPGGPWGRGRFSLEPGEEDEADPRPLSQMSGSFVLSEALLRVSQLDMRVSSNAHIAADFAVDLATDEHLPVAFQGRLDEADLAEVGPAAGLPDGFATGRVEMTADIIGHLERDKNLYAGLTGTIAVNAWDGEIEQKIPVAVKIATATDGFNPFAKSDKLQYETIVSELHLENGRLTANRFELEGPVRVYATGSLDFAEPPEKIDAVVGVFLFQRIRELLGMVPLVNLVVPGSDKGMVGAYFRVRGPLDDPDVDAMKLKSIEEELPTILSAPVDFIRQLWKSGARRDDASGSS